MRQLSCANLYYRLIIGWKAGVMLNLRTVMLVLIQPLIHPLFKTRPFQTSLLKWSGNSSDYETYLKNYWTNKVGGIDKL
jgi:hypothetical protein